MIERSLISVTVTAPSDKAGDVRGALRAAKSGLLREVSDAFRGDTIFYCEVPCERAPELYWKLSTFAGCKVFGVEAFQPVREV